MEIYSANVILVKESVTLSHGPDGQSSNLPGPSEGRLYLISSHQHGAARGPPGATVSSSAIRSNSAADTARAVGSAGPWSSEGVAPPPSSIPHLADGTLVSALPQDAMGFPKVPGVTYTGLKSTRYLLNYGPDFYRTELMTINRRPSRCRCSTNPRNGPIYPTYVPKTDADGERHRGHPPCPM